MTRRPPRYSPPPRSNSPKTSSESFGGFKPNYAMVAILGAIFVLGIFIGSLISTVGPTAENVASREVIDRSAPDAELCVQYGASAIVSDMRIFLTLNPFNVYVTQPVMQPGCVLRRNNWVVLEQKKLVDSQQVQDCKNRMNTFGYIGTIESKPEIDCIYQNEAAGNLFINQPGAVGPRPETDNF